MSRKRSKPTEKDRIYSREYNHEHRVELNLKRRIFRIQGTMRGEISVDTIKELYEKQQGLCAICKEWHPLIGRPEGMHIDHIHGSLIVRGLLCSRCNLMLGQARDNVRILEKAIEYLQSPIERSKNGQLILDSGPKARALKPPVQAPKTRGKSA